MKSLVTFCLSMTCAVLSTATAYAGAVPTWDRQIHPALRFRVLGEFDGEAVLDRETGLVWQRTQSQISDLGWGFAASICHFEEIGGRLGWRTPSVEELASLVDPAQDPPALPPNHPFDLGSLPVFLSATTALHNPDRALAVRMGGFTEFDQIVFSVDKSTSDIFSVLCVRGGRGVDGQ